VHLFAHRAMRELTAIHVGLRMPRRASTTLPARGWFAACRVWMRKE
jgi:hypothetical protein